MSVRLGPHMGDEMAEGDSVCEPLAAAREGDDAGGIEVEHCMNELCEQLNGQLSGGPEGGFG